MSPVLQPLPSSAPPEAQLDPVLRAFHEGDHLYNLRGPIHPGSIRDQMVRASLLVDNLVNWGILTPSGGSTFDSLAVLGGGAAGMTAALRAAQYGVQVTHFDGDRVRGNLHRIPQLGCFFRYISPTLYDWPMAHYNEDSLPWGGGGGLPLPFQGEVANQVANDWLLACTTAKQALGSCLLSSTGVDVEVLLLGSSSPTPDAPLLTPGGRLIVQEIVSGTRREFPVVIDCRGSVAEDVKLPLYQFPGTGGALHNQYLYGYPFWGWRPTNNVQAIRSQDALQPLNYGVVSAGARIIIIGSGDGALQDLLRACFWPDTHLPDVYDALLTDPDIAAALTTFREKSHAEERQAQRALKWLHGLRRTLELGIRKKLHFAYVQLIDDMLGDPQRCGAIDAILAPFIRRPSFDQLCLAWPHAFFGQCYPLNRFFALLLERRGFQLGLSIDFLPNTRVEYAIGPSRTDNPMDYIGTDYALYDEGNVLLGYFNVVIPRKGPRPPDGSQPRYVPFRTRQLFPFQMPY